jgi:hypothetical protein
MSWGIVAAAGASLVGSLVASNQASKAAQGAANAQTDAANRGIDKQHAQFEAIQKLLAPYVQGGTSAMGSQMDLLGLNGADAQKKAIDAIQQGPQFSALVKQGENSILQNASATGGLRGGNVQGALAQFSPQVLSALIDSQFSKLGSLSSLGQASAAGQAAAGQHTADQVTSLLGNIGSAQAGNYLAQGKISADEINNITKIGTNLIGKFF